MARYLSDVVKQSGWRAAVYNRRGHGQSSVLPGPIAPLQPCAAPGNATAANGTTAPRTLLPLVGCDVLAPPLARIFRQHRAK